MATKFERNVHEQWPDKALDILALIRGEVSPDEYPSVRRWTAQCYHPPSRHERTACALNEVLGAYGVEAIFGENCTEPVLEYLNMGDTYDATLCYVDGRWRVSSYGDEVERLGL